MLCSARASPLISGSFTFSSMARALGPMVELAKPTPRAATSVAV